MGSIGPSMKLKLKRDAFILPDGQGGVYFRNNQGSFEMAGRAIDQWIEKLLPVFDGEHAMGDLIDGLPPAYQDRILEIAEVLYTNGFVQDVSMDLPHSLPSEVLQRHAGQIEFVDNIARCGAFHFEQYRDSRILVVGHLGMAQCAVSALLESGVAGIHVALPMGEPEGRKRIHEIADYQRRFDADIQVCVVEIVMDETTVWDEMTREYDVILYLSAGDREALLKLEDSCRRTGTIFAPVVLTDGVALVGPIVQSSSELGWNSVWHRLHHTALHHTALHQRDSRLDSFVGRSLAANVAVFELFKTITNCHREAPGGRFYLLNLETLQGTWYSCLPHPVEVGRAEAAPIPDATLRLDASRVFAQPQCQPLAQPHSHCSCESHPQFQSQADLPHAVELLPFFAELTNPVCGIFHTWDEGEYEQLPLSVCSVQSVDALSEGPAKLLSMQIGTGLTHEEARKEAGLLGIEAYVGQLLQSFMTEGETADIASMYGVGSGETFAESLWRALKHALIGQLAKRSESHPVPVQRANLCEVEDDVCSFYLTVLDALKVTPLIGLGEGLFGLPVAWVGDPGRFFAGVGLSRTMALRDALEAYIVHQTTLAEGLPAGSAVFRAVQAPSLQVADGHPLEVAVPSAPSLPESAQVQSAIEFLRAHSVEFSVWDAAIEPFLQGIPGGVIVVRLRQGASQ